MAEGANWQALLDDMHRRDIAANPVNCVVWADHLAGTKPQMSRIIRIWLSNRRRIDDSDLLDLYRRYCDPKLEQEALAAITERVQATLAEMQACLASGSPLPRVAERMVGDAQAMLRQTEGLGRHLFLSASRMEQLERTLEEARREAASDALTGLANRRRLDLALHTLAGNAMNSGRGLALLLADIDHFKAVNDTYGHPTGDEVLRLVATVMKSCVRGQDLVARYGGEEFAVLLPDTTERGALAVAENLRHAIAAQSLAVMPAVVAKPAIPSPEERLASDPDPDTDLAAAAIEPETVKVTVTVSIGLACYNPGESLTGWFSRADRALYYAKRSGRNQVALDMTRSAAA